MAEFIDWNDESIDIKKRKKAFSDWLINKGEDEHEARKKAVIKFSMVDWNDESHPIGKRKVSFVKWLMMQGETQYMARAKANKKFGY